jgi:hypothetical protein
VRLQRQLGVVDLVKQVEDEHDPVLDELEGERLRAGHVAGGRRHHRAGQEGGLGSKVSSYCIGHLGLDMITMLFFTSVDSRSLFRSVGQ